MREWYLSTKLTERNNLNGYVLITEKETKMNVIVHDRVNPVIHYDNEKDLVFGTSLTYYNTVRVILTVFVECSRVMTNT